MAKTNENREKKENTIEQEFVSIEEMKQKQQTQMAVFQGVCAAEGWNKGKMVTPDQYNGAVAMYLRSSIRK